MENKREVDSSSIKSYRYSILIIMIGFFFAIAGSSLSELYREHDKTVGGFLMFQNLVLKPLSWSASPIPMAISNITPKLVFHFSIILQAIFICRRLWISFEAKRIIVPEKFRAEIKTCITYAAIAWAFGIACTILLYLVSILWPENSGPSVYIVGLFGALYVLVMPTYWTLVNCIIGPGIFFVEYLDIKNNGFKPNKSLQPTAERGG